MVDLHICNSFLKSHLGSYFLLKSLIGTLRHGFIMLSPNIFGILLSIRQHSLSSLAFGDFIHQILVQALHPLSQQVNSNLVLLNLGCQGFLCILKSGPDIGQLFLIVGHSLIVLQFKLFFFQLCFGNLSFVRLNPLCSVKFLHFFKCLNFFLIFLVENILDLRFVGSCQCCAVGLPLLLNRFSGRGHQIFIVHF